MEIDVYVYVQPINIWGAAACSTLQEEMCESENLKFFESNYMFPVLEFSTEKEARCVQDEEVQKLRSDLGEEKAKAVRGVCRSVLSFLA